MFERVFGKLKNNSQQLGHGDMLDIIEYADKHKTGHISMNYIRDEINKHMKNPDNHVVLNYNSYGLNEEFLEILHDRQC